MIKASPHPATSDRLYTDEETEFLMAMQSFKHETGRQFPTVRDMLLILKSIGYQKTQNPIGKSKDPETLGTPPVPQ